MDELLAGLRRTSMHHTGVDPQFSAVGLREMVVVDTVYVDQDNNRSKAYTEYTIRDVMTGEFAYGVRRLSAGLGDPLNGDDNVIHPATNLLPGASSTKLSKNTPATLTDGTRVLVGFIEGSITRGVIVGVFPHPSQTFGATAADGERRYTVHQGTSIQIKSDGTYVLMNKAGASFTMTPDGDIVATPASGKAFYAGTQQGADQPIPLGNMLATWLQTLLNALLSATYPTAFGPSGPMLPPAQETLTELISQIQSLLSTMAFVQPSI